jgi:DNA-binding CsgD family transcriptional regulator
VGAAYDARYASLLEREAELELIDAALAGSVGRDGYLLVFEGPAGIGKTVLLQETRRRALTAGLTTAVAHGSEFDREFPYAVIRQLFEPLIRAADAAGRERLLTGAAQFAGPVVLADAPERSTISDDGFAVINGLYWLAVNLSSESPLVLIVDDLHWADLASLRFLLYLARRLEGLRISIVASMREGESIDPALVDELTATVAMRRSAPDALSEAAVGELLGPLFGREPDPQFARRCHHATGGNPLLVHELAKALVADGVEPDATSQETVDATGPEAIARSALLRLGRLSEDTLTLAQALAVLGRDATLARAAAIAELDDQRAFAALDLLVATGFVELEPSIQFAHPVVRAAIYNELAPGRRTVVHRGIADLLVTEGELDATAGHLLLSQPIGSAETIAILQRAAAHAFALGVPGNAATYLARALEEGPSRELRAELLLELGTALKMTGQIAGALGRLDQAASTAEHSVTRVRAVIEASMLRVYGGDWEGPLKAIEGALAELGEQDLELLLKTEASLTAMLGYDERLVSRLDARLSELDELADRSGAAAGPLLMCLSALGALRGRPNDVTRARVARAWDDGRFLGDSVALELLPQGCYGLLVCDELGDLEQIVDALHEYATVRGSLVAFIVATTVASSLATRRGRLSAAEADLRLACERAIEHGYQFALPTLLWGSADVLLERESAADLATLAETIDPVQMPNSFNAAIIYEVRGRLRYAAGDRLPAVADMRSAGRIFDALRCTNPNAIPWRSTLALMLEPDERDEALALAWAELDYARAIGQPRGVGTALHALGVLTGGESGVGHLEQAVAALAQSPARLLHARALVSLGATLRRGRARAAARQPLLEGLELAARCGAERLVGEAREELAAAGARPRRLYQTSRDALTPSQLRVAEMAADGRSTRDIAQALFVTTRTVDAHLQHAYAKLGINSRKQLKDALEQAGVAGS